MQTEIKVRNFQCQLHPQEAVKRVLPKVEARKLLYCIDCMAETDPSLKSSFLSLEGFVNLIYSQILASKSYKINSSPPDNLMSFLEEEFDNFGKLSSSIAEQKKLIQDTMKGILNEITKNIQKIAEELIGNLDAQLVRFKRNYDEYKKRISKFFRTDFPDYLPISKDTIIQDLNASENIKELEIKIRTYLKEIDEIYLTKNQKENEAAIMENLTFYKNKLVESSASFPVAAMSNKEDFYAAYDHIKTGFANFYESISKITNEIPKLEPLQVDSFILSPIDLRVLKDIVISNRRVNLKLIYRAEKNNTNFDQIEEKINYPNGNIIVVGKTHKEGVIGYYRFFYKSPLGSDSEAEIKRSATLFDLKKKATRKDCKINIGRQGLYGLEESMLITSNQRNGSNFYYYEQINRFKLDLKMNDYLFLCIFMMNGFSMGTLDHDYWDKILYGITEFEIFEVEEY